MAIFLKSSVTGNLGLRWQPEQIGSSRRLRVAITTRQDGNLSFRYGTAHDVSERRARVFKELAVPVERVVPLSLELSYGVHWLDEPPSVNGLSEIGFPSEGVWTADREIVLFLFVADCFPIAISDQRTGSFGVFHAGRAELQAGLLADFLELGKSRGIRPDSLDTYIGPGICPAHYVFQERPEGYRGPSVRDDQGVWHVDLHQDIVETLVGFGADPDRIVSDGRCTYESPELFSHRRAQGVGEGRFGIVVQPHG